MNALHHSALSGLTLINRGKVRDVYEVDADHLLIVATDRLSAFDVVLPQPIPGKGEVLTRVANFWFARTRDIIPNHLSDRPLSEVVRDPAERAALGERAIVVKKLKPLPVEAIVRGYLIGSGWKDYQATGAICGIALPAGLQQAAKLPAPIFTPSSKADMGEHDENISFEQAQARCEALMKDALAGTGKTGAQLAEEARAAAIALYSEAAEFAATRGILIADQVRVRHRRRRHAAPDRRGADPRLLALLAGGRLPRGHQPAVLRQAVRARLPGDAGLEQDRARPEAAGPRHRAHRRQVP